MNWKYILIIVILAAIVAGGILAYQYWLAPKQEVKVPEIKPPEVKAPEEVPPEEVPVDETANWRVYRNEEYGFEIRYLSEWQHKVDKNYIGFYDPQKIKFFAPNELTIRMFPKENNISLDKWVQELPEIKSETEIQGKAPSGSFRNINNISFYVVDTINFEGGNTIANAFLEKNGSVIEFSRNLLAANDRGIFNQILSTFRFLE
ncbi:hypothetical protein AUJ27_04285 [Candidatus Falkowbacteria bacterium CG1_02_37_44]|uniref:PsbP C-terminal domain-containing protein n=2 Tax=Bacteria candidate phyla TaxID=1783234 RepID=A0A2M7VKD5_9BACT|nr:MAG: hypothetical protein AUJ27_04285 [Candidatus Falkowbacteria bacterium CG1_02_37_44]PJA02297.1 MAG: hypothetical protein COX73_01520 [bacterium (Candidatus Gribaldobacteria) CG_4_10_14_0_2_um_filter_36_18]